MTTNPGLVLPTVAQCERWDRPTMVFPPLCYSQSGNCPHSTTGRRSIAGKSRCGARVQKHPRPSRGQIPTGHGMAGPAVY